MKSREELCYHLLKKIAFLPLKKVVLFMNFRADAKLGKKTQRVFMLNTKQYQSIDSDVCGQYCIYYLSKRAINHKMEEILSIFNKKKRKENDVYVRTYIHNKFNC